LLTEPTQPARVGDVAPASSLIWLEPSNRQ